MDRLIAAWDWLDVRLRGRRCFTCGRRLTWHSPRQMRFCDSAPLPFEVADPDRSRMPAAS